MSIDTHSTMLTGVLFATVPTGETVDTRVRTASVIVRFKSRSTDLCLENSPFGSNDMRKHSASRLRCIVVVIS